MVDHFEETFLYADSQTSSVYVVEYLDDDGNVREGEFDTANEADQFVREVGRLRVRPCDDEEYTEEEYQAITGS